MSSAGLEAAVAVAVDDAVEGLNGLGLWPQDIDTPELRAIIAAITRAVLERLEAQASVVEGAIQISGG